ncbi:MAG: DUF2191 domain-containing protein [Deltaproteobacteria bacterium]|nr:DUF2191 domain-containing protein [Deltaproteobacteria bacterium]
MVRYMKTTVDISSALLNKAKAIASRDKTTLRNLVEEGLRTVIVAKHHKTNFHLRRASVNGQGLNPLLSSRSWDEIRELAYKGRGT